jgi:AcrR family transcriptional regulator
MQEVQTIKSSKPVGLRGRKRAESHARIQAEAIRLFLERGFDATTLDDIANAADVSRRTLFHYFASKEEIVFSTRSDFPDLIAEAVRQRPVDEPLLDMVENVLRDLSSHYQSTQARGLARLIHNTPTLRAGEQAKYEKVEQVLVRALADRKGLPDSNLACRVTAAVAIGMLKLSIEAWLSEEDAGSDHFGRAAFAALRSELGGVDK